MNVKTFTFDENVASQYESWYDTVEGQKADILEKRALRRLLHRFPSAHNVLDVGAGTGHFTRWLSTEGMKVVGLDFSAAMLREAERQHTGPWVQGNGCELPFIQGAFDLVVFITTLEFLECPSHALKEGLRVSRLGLLLGVLNRCSVLGIRRRLQSLFKNTIYNYAHFYRVKELKRLLIALTDEKVQLEWETTYLPPWGPKCLSNLRWGNFIVMALMKPSCD